MSELFAEKDAADAGDDGDGEERDDRCEQAGVDEVMTAMAVKYATGIAAITR